MPISQIAAFGTIRLGGIQATASGSNRLKLGGADATMLVSDSGAFTSSASLASTGSTLYVMLTGASGQLTTNSVTAATLTITGQTLYNDIIGLSGQVNTSLGTTGNTLYVDLTGLSGQFNANQANFLTAIVTGTFSMTGSGSMVVTFPTPFITVPNVVNPSFVMYTGNSYGYQVWTSQVTTTQYVALFSDVVGESGNSLSTYAHV